MAGAYFIAGIGRPPKVEIGVEGAKAEVPNGLLRLRRPIASSCRNQLKSVKVETVGEREFPIEKFSVGSIDFDEDLLIQVFTPYKGRIVGIFAEIGDEVKKGQVLFRLIVPIC